MFPGILQRYVIGAVARTFVLALVAVTAVIVVFMVMAEATRAGLAPADLVRLVPYLIPGSLPFTIPVSLLFAVSVVYGRLASDNEITAIKSAGVSATKVIWPSIFFAAFLSFGLQWISSNAIPIANHRAKLMLFDNIEDMLYKVLKKERMFNNSRWPFAIMVKDVEDRTLINPVFKRKAKAGGKGGYDLQIWAREAQLQFDVERSVALVHLVDATYQPLGNSPDVGIINEKDFELPIPDDLKSLTPKKRVQEMTVAEIELRQIELKELIATERQRQSIASSLWIASGRLERVDWPHIQAAFADYRYWEREWNEMETEKHFRLALSFGPVFFVMLGAPVGILFARRDFLSAFMTCFLPIILIYYPLTLAGVNLGKEGLLLPQYSLWMGNIVLGVIAGLVLPSILKH